MHALLLLPTRSRLSVESLLPPWSSPDDLHAPMSSYPHQSIQPSEILVAPPQGQKNHIKCARKEREKAANLKGCKGEGHQTCLPGKPRGTKYNNSISINFSAKTSSTSPPRKRHCPQGGLWQYNPPRKGPGQCKGLLRWMETLRCWQRPPEPGMQNFVFFKGKRTAFALRPQRNTEQASQEEP